MSRRPQDIHCGRHVVRTLCVDEFKAIPRRLQGHQACTLGEPPSQAPVYLC
ncbi:conserved hypothetical protein [Verticillium alfalfae VaMs.102]|uniref:Uncharacterized protein n=1 Tax=Verticillium alfalfae (strain VaMs.102 / ATCC MYA-4576 / FGSC 10136) TaxID=526221 RepID=C9SSF9_VERA1|nr:conserved hypothetical protein [Verticillium alfalfae VaMs.102]EEY21724.1 conserved hypothetical protein [Verticillium alfalfae VaMs.102]